METRLGGLTPSALRAEPFGSTGAFTLLGTTVEVQMPRQS